ncbi:MAG: hypothetical protein LKI29_05225 [Bacteroides sp.]|jgi:hypothetical protein|nr:hypothetical protein [Bacteroides sp.]
MRRTFSVLVSLFFAPAEANRMLYFTLSVLRKSEGGTKMVRRKCGEGTNDLHSLKICIKIVAIVMLDSLLCFLLIFSLLSSILAISDSDNLAAFLSSPGFYPGKRKMAQGLFFT